MTGEFYEKLNTAELEYAQAGKQGDSNDDALFHLFTTLGRNVSMLATDDLDDESVSQAASDAAIQQCGRCDFQRLVEEVKTGFR
jgi:hypothetical protein